MDLLTSHGSLSSLIELLYLGNENNENLIQGPILNSVYFVHMAFPWVLAIIFLIKYIF